ncbi:MAG TPA: glycosyltransferase family 4 protein [Ignavibacteriaceae bacterium]|nr:glycosyltransferase family 4 protein [Ignavibacteriaceae bacterium]
MKVLFTFGGLPHYYNAILNRLNSVQEIEVHAAVPTNAQNTIGKGVFQSDKGIEFKLHYLKEYKTYYGKLFFKEFISLIRKEKPDILVIIWPYILAFIFKPHIYFILKLMGTKIIFKEIPFQVPEFNKAQDYYFSDKFVDENLNKYVSTNSFTAKLKYYFFPRLIKLYYRLIDATVNYTESAYKIIESYGVAKEKIFITYNSPDTDSLQEAKNKAEKEGSVLSQNSHRIIHVGRLVKWKKVDLLIEAVNILKQKYENVELIVVGKGPEENNLKTMSENLGIANNVNFVGSIYDPVLLGRYLLDSSIYVLAGMGGLSINEAMCFGKPIICSVCDGTEKHLVIKDYNGKYFEEDNTSDLAIKIDNLFSNPETIKEMGANSEKIIHDKINVNTVINGYLKAFNYVCPGKIRLNS